VVISPLPKHQPHRAGINSCLPNYPQGGDKIRKKLSARSRKSVKGVINNQKEQGKKRDREKFTEEDVVMLEMASRLNVIDSFETKFLNDTKSRYFEHGCFTAITEKQRVILNKLADRCKAVTGL